MRTRVVHIGNAADSPGGIASVIRQHLRRAQVLGVPVEAWPSYDVRICAGRRLRLFFRTFRRIVASDLSSTVVHVHLSRGGSVVREGSLAAVARLKQARVVVTVHGSSSASARPITTVLYRVALRSAHVVHLLSDVHRRLIRPGDSRIVVISNDIRYPIDVPAYSMRRRTVLFAGAIGRRKGVDTLVEAWRRMARSDWHLILAGEATAESTEILADLPASAEYVGYLLPPAIVDQLLTCRIVVLPSRAEALPMIVCEAMASGCAVIASRVGALPQLLSDSDGQLVPPADVSELGRALGRLMDDEGFASNLAGANREAAKQFDSNLVVELWRDVYFA